MPGKTRLRNNLYYESSGTINPTHSVWVKQYHYLMDGACKASNLCTVSSLKAKAISAKSEHEKPKKPCINRETNMFFYTRKNYTCIPVNTLKHVTSASYISNVQCNQLKSLPFKGFFSVRLHVMQRTVLLSEFCPSVRPSVCLPVRCVYCGKIKQEALLLQRNRATRYVS